MKPKEYLEEKTFLFIFLTFFLFFIFLFLYFIDINPSLLLLLFFVIIIGITIYLWIDYHKIQKQFNNIINLVNNLDQKYLLTEVLPTPNRISDKAYYYALKKATKSMCEVISEREHQKEEYQQYIESWVHEIKTPISAISLLCDNQKDDRLKKEIQKIDNYVEQVLYYARSENTEKDYFIKEISLEELIHPSLLDFKERLLDEKITVDINQLEYMVYTDEKWIHFIVNQIISNSIKYQKEHNRTLMIRGEKTEQAVILSIEDHGIGISKEDLPRIFEAGFTGSNRKKSNATGMGLFLCKKLCDKLDLDITVTSEKNKYTKVSIYFPIGKVHTF